MPDLNPNGDKDPDRDHASLASLTAVQRDICWIVHNFDAETRREIQDRLDTYRNHSYSRPHVLRTLTDLGQLGLLDIGSAGQETTASLTEAGRRALQRRRAWIDGHPEGTCA